MNFYHLKDGRVTDICTQFDGVAMRQQLGSSRSDALVGSQACGRGRR
jgi:hypothetical protein